MLRACHADSTYRFWLSGLLIIPRWSVSLKGFVATLFFANSFPLCWLEPCEGHWSPSLSAWGSFGFLTSWETKMAKSRWDVSLCSTSQITPTLDIHLCWIAGGNFPARILRKATLSMAAKSCAPFTWQQLFRKLQKEWRPRASPDFYLLISLGLVLVGICDVNGLPLVFLQ